MSDFFSLPWFLAGIGIGSWLVNLAFTHRLVKLNESLMNSLVILNALLAKHNDNMEDRS